MKKNENFIKEKNGYDIIDNTEENIKKVANSAWGFSYIELLAADWNDIKNGKALCFNDGEYSYCITVNQEDIKNEIESFWEKMFIKKENECELLRKQLKTVLDENKHLKRP